MILVGDVIEKLETLEPQSVQTCVTSPPYWGLRDYGVEGQLGLEKTPQEFVANMVEVFRGVRRVLRDDGTLWLNIGDSYARQGGKTAGVPRHWDGREADPGGLHDKRSLASEIGMKPKDLCLIPERLAIALQDDGWWIRSRIAWCKKSSMPESVTDRPTSAWEHIWLLTKSARYYYDAEAVKTSNGANLRNYRVLGPEPYPEAHFATFPSEIPRRCIKAGTSQKGACSECGAPWERVTDREPSQYAQGMTTRTHRDDTQPGNVGNTRNENGIVPYLKPVQATTTGWQPTCDCDAEVVPCTVLDPFLGSGTTAAVAQELDREWVGIELNPEYAVLAEKRIAKVGAPQIGLSI